MRRAFQLQSIFFAAMLLSPIHAWAAGFMVRENSAEGVAMSYAGNGSRASGPDTVFANPAGMTRVEGSEWEAGAAVILPSFKFNGVARSGGAPIAGNNGGDSGRAALVPDLYGAFELGGGFFGGIAVTAPFGNASEYDKGWYGRYLGTKTSALSVDINPNIAYRIDDTWSIGGGVSAQYLKLDVTSAIDQAAIFGPGAPDAFYRFKAHDWAFGFNAGLLASFQSGTRVGFSYRSIIDHDIAGSLDFTGASPLLGMISGPAHAKTRLPATIGLSVTQDIDPDLSLSADIQFSQWSVFKDVVIQSQNPPFANTEGYRDSWMIALGGSYKLDENWSLRSGIAIDQTPVTSAFRAVTLPDGDRLLLGIGSEYRINESMAVEAAYGHAMPLGHPNMNSSINNTDPITHSVMLSGQYDVAVDIVALSVRVGL